MELESLERLKLLRLERLLDKLDLPLDFVQDVMYLDLIKASDIIHVNPFIIYTIH